jgi:quercetin dioxygenase-like cupin family protein
MPATIVKAGDRSPLNILGMPLTMLCEARETGGSWSLFEEEVPLGMGPPPHRHDWDEAYYILDGEVDFEVDGEPVRSAKGDFNYLPRNTVHGFRDASQVPARVLILHRRHTARNSFTRSTTRYAACRRMRPRSRR